ncbi:MAG: class IV adenylate cyclase [Rickettsiales bacterium]|nr:class IV adenylate cyclase [Rickettsiales bacterium]
MLNLEIEYKFKINNKKEVKNILDKIAEKSYNRQYQSNIMFDNKDGLMQTTNSRVRLRLLGDTGNKVLTYKKPLESVNGAKREIEYEINFSDKDEQIEKIINAMEFHITTSYERYRTEWKIGKVHITIDEYPFADFVEIEGEQEEIEEVAKKLELDFKNALDKPADTLFQEWRKEKGLGFKTEMRFEDYNK